ncbi:MAG: cytochrome C [Balneolaceae bacterium]|nr:MAG: cytochrome C [Balneolaceae bacterium]
MKILKWMGMAVGVLLLMIAILATILFLISKKHENTIYQIDVAAIDYLFEDEEEMLSWGQHVATIRGCVDCHGGNLGGDIFLKDPVVGVLTATNLTTGTGGIGSEYSDEDLIRAIRHGVRKDGKSVIFMPSHEYNVIDSKDMAAMIAYIRSMEPVDSSHLPETKIGFPFRLMYVLSGDDIHLFPARLIDHTLPLPDPVENRTPRELGAYLATTCMGCHGNNYGGGRIPGVPPNWPDASNITMGGTLVNYASKDDFIKTMRDGITPLGAEMDSEFMPWTVFGYMTDEELSGLFEYLQSLPPRETGSR